MGTEGRPLPPLGARHRYGPTSHGCSRFHDAVSRPEAERGKSACSSPTLRFTQCWARVESFWPSTTRVDCDQKHWNPQQRIGTLELSGSVAHDQPRTLWLAGSTLGSRLSYSQDGFESNRALPATRRLRVKHARPERHRPKNALPSSDLVALQPSIRPAQSSQPTPCLGISPLCVSAKKKQLDSILLLHRLLRPPLSSPRPPSPLPPFHLPTIPPSATSTPALTLHPPPPSFSKCLLGSPSPVFHAVPPQRCATTACWRLPVFWLCRAHDMVLFMRPSGFV